LYSLYDDPSVYQRLLDIGRTMMRALPRGAFRAQIGDALVAVARRSVR
jgi:hypothetical protein